MLKTICKRLSRFDRETEGSYTVEVLLVLPALVWVNIACYSYFNNGNDTDTWIRVTVVTYSSSTSSYSVSWSKASSANAPVLTAASLADMTDILPTIAAGYSLILVYTHLDYSSPFDVELDLSEITQRVITRPQLNFSSS